MGLSGISVPSLLLIFGIAALLFGTNRLRTVGRDLGEAVAGLREGLKEGAKKKPDDKDGKGDA